MERRRSRSAKNNNLIKSFIYAWRGTLYCFKTQRSFRIHAFAAGVVFFLAWRLDLAQTEMLILALTVALVLVAEMFNTVAEAVVDLASPRYDPLAKVAKDVAAGAVLIAALAALVVGYLVFLRKFL